MADDVHPPPSKLPPACRHLIRWIIEPWERITANGKLPKAKPQQEEASRSPSPSPPFLSPSFTPFHIPLKVHGGRLILCVRGRGSQQAPPNLSSPSPPFLSSAFPLSAQQLSSEPLGPPGSVPAGRSFPVPSALPRQEEEASRSPRLCPGRRKTPGSLSSGPSRRKTPGSVLTSLQPPSSPEPPHGAPELSLIALCAPQLPPWQQHRPSELRLRPSSPAMASSELRLLPSSLQLSPRGSPGPLGSVSRLPLDPSPSLDPTAREALG